MELVEEIKRAVEYTKQKEYKKAEKIYLELLKEYPENPSLLSFLGILYFNLDKYKQAEKYLEKAYKQNSSKSIISFIGLSKFFQKKYISALPYLKKAEYDDKSYAIYDALINTLDFCEDYPQAYYYAKFAIKIFPLDEKFLYYAGLYALYSGNFKESEQYSAKLLILNHKSIDGWYLKGLIIEVLYGNGEQARVCYKNIVKYGNKEYGYHNLAISYLKEKGCRKKAYYYLNKAKKLNKVFNSSLLYLLAVYYLTVRQFKKGYKYYVQSSYDSDNGIILDNNFKDKWNDKNYKQETLFVYGGDQGLGDQLQFIRYLPYLAKKFKMIKLMVSKSLIDLFKLSYKDYENIKFYPIADTYPKYDKSLFLSHSLYCLNKNFKNIPYRNGYLIADDEKIKKYKTKYFNTSKLKIGICWEAGHVGFRDLIHRTLNVELFEDIINLENAEVYSFQVSPSLESYKKYSKLIDVGATFDDFDDTASALKNLDVLVTVDTSVAHLAGALGVKTFMLLPYYSDWRWFDNTETTEWYDSVKIFKQTSKNSWDNEFNRILTELTLMLKK